MSRRRLADNSLRDTDWQAQEYERVKGKEARERQELAAKQERKACTCRHRVVRGRGGYRTIHQRDCIKFKDWMNEYLDRPNPSGAAHAAAIREPKENPRVDPF